MARKVAKSKTSIHKRASSIKKKAPVKTITKQTVARTVTTQPDKKLIENFVALQKVMVNLSVKLDQLTNQISKLLELFEISAKSLAKKEINLGGGSKDTKEVLKKIDNLFEQNKVIARGLTLMHDRMSGQQIPRQPRPAQAQPQYPKPVQPRPQPPQPRPQPSPQKSAGPSIQGYEKSLSSQPSQPTEFKKLKKKD